MYRTALQVGLAQLSESAACARRVSFFACAANIDGVIYRTANNLAIPSPNYPNKISLETVTGFILVNPSYMITTDILTRNIIDSTNYISISPNITTIYTLIWKL